MVKCTRGLTACRRHRVRLVPAPLGHLFPGQLAGVSLLSSIFAHLLFDISVGLFWVKHEIQDFVCFSDLVLGIDQHRTYSRNSHLVCYLRLHPALSFPIPVFRAKPVCTFNVALRSYMPR